MGGARGFQICGVLHSVQGIFLCLAGNYVDHPGFVVWFAEDSYSSIMKIFLRCTVCICVHIETPIHTQGPSFYDFLSTTWTPKIQAAGLWFFFSPASPMNWNRVWSDAHRTVQGLYFWICLDISGTNTLWWTNIAIENGPFIDGLPIKNCYFPLLG